MYCSSLIPVGVIATQLPLLEFFQILVIAHLVAIIPYIFEVTIQSHILFSYC